MPVDIWEVTEIVCRGFRPWRCDTGSSSHFTKLVTSSDPHGPSVTDPCLTHCRRCSHPHAHHMLACRPARFLACTLPRLHASSLLASSLTCLHPLLARLSRACSFPYFSARLPASCSLLFSLLLLLSPFPSSYFSLFILSQNGPPILFSRVALRTLALRELCVVLLLLVLLLLLVKTKPLSFFFLFFFSRIALRTLALKALSHLDVSASVWQGLKMYVKRWRTLNY